MARYWDGTRLPPSDTLITLSETLGVSPAWLIRGGDRGAGLLVAANDADWVSVDEFDLRNLSDHGKGAAISRTVIRRDWLYLALGDSAGLWIARLLSAEHSLGLPAGAAIFCKDHSVGEAPVEGQHYIFRVNGGVVLGRFSFRGTGPAIGDRIGEAVVTPADLLDGDHQHFIVAHVLGALARPL